MPTVNIEGVGRVQVDDSFLRMSPEEQSKAVEEIATQAQGARAAPMAPQERMGIDYPQANVDPALQSAAKERGTAWRGNILPVRRDVSGGVHFDSDAGILGMAKGLAGTVADYGRAIGETKRGAPVTTETIDRVIPMGPLATPLTPGVRVGEGFAGAISPGKTARQATPSTPSGVELKAAGSTGFDTAREMGVDYSPSVVAETMTNLKYELQRKGYRAKQAPRAFDVIDDLTRLPKAGPDERVVLSLDDLHSARRSLQKAAQDFTNPTEQAVASIAIKRIDEFITRADPASVVAGPARAAGDTFGEALGNYAAAARSREFAGKKSYAELRAAAANSGSNIDNALRQRVADLFNPSYPERLSGFTPDERALLDQFIRGGKARNTARNVSNFLGGGRGLGAMVSGGVGGTAGSFFGPVGAGVGFLAPPTLGVTTKALQNRLARKEMELIDDVLRQRSPLYAKLRAKQPMEAISPMRRTAIIRGILAEETAAARPSQRRNDLIFRLSAGLPPT